MLWNFDNNAWTIPVEVKKFKYKLLTKDDMLKMRITIKEALLGLTNIDK